jgi:uncharacterized RDD family membrane protein YckC
VNCPACGAATAAERCPGCGALVGPPTEGALAPQPAPVSGKVKPMRGLPGQRHREHAWKDEVRERVKSRKQQKDEDPELPLFPEPGAESYRARGGPSVTEEDPNAAGMLDLPLRPAESETAGAERTSPRLGRTERLSLVAGEPAEPEPGPRPLERPAHVGERVAAAAVDGLLLALAAAVVVYFAGRAARVPLLGLLPAWPWILGFVGMLGLAYAVCFTGLTGQTPGKSLLGLRVVDGAGDPPGHLRAAARVVLGLAGLAALLLGALPMLFDPARRALHDRLLRTRVVRV